MEVFASVVVTNGVCTRHAATDGVVSAQAGIATHRNRDPNSACADPHCLVDNEIFAPAADPASDRDTCTSTPVTPALDAAAWLATCTPHTTAPDVAFDDAAPEDTAPAEDEAVEDGLGCGDPADADEAVDDGEGAAAVEVGAEPAVVASVFACGDMCNPPDGDGLPVADAEGDGVVDGAALPPVMVWIETGDDPADLAPPPTVVDTLAETAEGQDVAAAGRAFAAVTELPVEPSAVTGTGVIIVTAGGVESSAATAADATGMAPPHTPPINPTATMAPTRAPHRVISTPIPTLCWRAPLNLMISGNLHAFRIGP
ncbi:hypothetical protein [Rudaeicoccus suwonensis]|uniref:hypothetical protein n=1 Tax=Rudaeicoccus suwonensis TaxID=657409 RepID=UPI001BA9B22B|nr:hypothetical protein [Rudaeicoccus suwonensis]